MLNNRIQNVDQRYIARNSNADDLEVIGTDGDYVIDRQGKRYLDLVMGWCVGNLGWSNREILERLRQFNGPTYVGPSFLYQPWAELAELLISIAPGKLRKCFRATGGTEAVELALRASIAHTERREFLSIEGAYHGNSIGATSVGSPERFEEGIIGCHRLSPPLDLRAADRAERLLKERKIAAVIMEPVVFNLNVLVPEKEFMRRLQELCRRYGTLLIMDEVATGFGRTGKLFACEYFGIEPDLMCLAKSITGGYAPMGATLATEEVAQSMRRKAGFYSTYGWHPLAVEAALANIQCLIRNHSSILRHVSQMSAFFRSRLERMPFGEDREIRAMGLAIGVGAPGKNLGKLTARARERGLLISAGGNSLNLFPALNIEREVAGLGLEILDECVSQELGAGKGRMPRAA